MAQQNWKLVLKFVVAVSLMVGLGTCLFTCFEFYLEFPTYTDISMVNQNESLFAAVTFCPEPDSKSKAKLAVLKVSKFKLDLSLKIHCQKSKSSAAILKTSHFEI